MGKADLHIHSTYSHDGTATVPAILDYVKHQTDLDVIAITDHDAIRGALEAMELAPRYGLEVVPGLEVSTADGHLLALFVTELVPRDMSLLDTVICVGEMGGLCVAPHPCGRWQGCLNERAIRAALADQEAQDALVGIESYNASLLQLRDNRRSAALADHLQLSQIGNSDAHLLSMIGRGATRFPGANAEALRLALERKWTEPLANGRPWHYIPSYLVQRTFRRLGFAADTVAAPAKSSPFRRLIASDLNALR